MGCKQAVKIGRKSAVKSYPNLSITSAPLEVLKARPDRVAVIFTTATVITAGTVVSMTVESDAGGEWTIVGHVSNTHPTAVMRIEDYGQIITGNLRFSSPTGAGLNGHVTEEYLTEGIDAL
jgi:hypothetical protein